MAYHTQTVSQTEWINQEVKAFLWHYMNYQKNDQMKQLYIAEFQYNNKRYVVIDHMLFKMNFEKPNYQNRITKVRKIPRRTVEKLE